jgi:excisionase family DNA binding protein
VSLGWLSPEAREELVGLVREVVRKERGAQEREEARRQWLTTEQVAKLVGTSDNAVRLRVRRGWLAGDVARDGKRLLVRRSAVLDWLDRRAER